MGRREWVGRLGRLVVLLSDSRGLLESNTLSP